MIQLIIGITVAHSVINILSVLTTLADCNNLYNEVKSDSRLFFFCFLFPSSGSDMSLIVTSTVQQSKHWALFYVSCKVINKQTKLVWSSNSWRTDKVVTKLQLQLKATICPVCCWYTSIPPNPTTYPPMLVYSVPCTNTHHILKLITFYPEQSFQYIELKNIESNSQIVHLASL